MLMELKFHRHGTKVSPAWNYHFLQEKRLFLLYFRPAASKMCSTASPSPATFLPPAVAK